MNYFLFLLLLTSFFVDCVRYDRYSGMKLNEKQILAYVEKQSLEVCTVELKQCTLHEGSRLDGTCNNVKHPSRGSANGRYLRLLDSEYGPNGTFRTRVNGEPLPSARKVRNVLQSTGRVEDKVTFNVAAVQFAGLLAFDISASAGILNAINKRNCCSPKGSKNPRCSPIKVSDDDPFLKMTGIRCLNFTRATTFQDLGCLPDAIPLEQVNYATPVIDLGPVYQNGEEESAFREGKNGLLKMRNGNGKTFPDLDDGFGFCKRNGSSTCYRFGNKMFPNLDLRTASFTIFFMREHNRLAKELKRLNPCWRDDRLFKVARQLNVASAQNIFMYEFLSMILGYKNMLNNGLISQTVEHISAYNEEAVPLVYAEFVIAMRYFHTFVDTRMKLYNESYRYTGELSLSNTLFKPILLQENKMFEEINRGTFYQHAAKADDILDPEISQSVYGGLQEASDLSAIDIQRGRDYGVKPYNKYRKLCGMNEAKTFDDFLDVIDVEKIDALKHLYEKVDDVELLAGIISERHVTGGSVGPTLFCIMTKQLQLLRFSDRFWFERGGQAHSLKLEQLTEIRKTTMARIACDNAEGISFIQTRALHNIKPGNQPVPCSQIPRFDMSKWRDDSCQQQPAVAGHTVNHPLYGYA